MHATKCDVERNEYATDGCHPQAFATVVQRPQLPTKSEVGGQQTGGNKVECFDDANDSVTNRIRSLEDVT